MVGVGWNNYGWGWKRIIAERLIQQQGISEPLYIVFSLSIFTRSSSIEKRYRVLVHAGGSGPAAGRLAFRAAGGSTHASGSGGSAWMGSVGY